MKESILKIVTFKWQHRKGYKLPSIESIGQYGADHVNKLYRGVTRNLTIPHEFICITDDPTGIECKTFPMWNIYSDFGGCYRRLLMFHPVMKQMIGERFVWMDLDTVVVGNLDKLFSRPEKFVMHTYYGKLFEHQIYNGCMLMMDAGVYPHVWENFKGGESVQKLAALKEAKQYIGTDQAWINYQLGDDEARFNEEDGIYEFSRIRVPPYGSNRNAGALPKNACLVMFSGKRDPSQFVKQYNWVRENWV